MTLCGCSLAGCEQEPGGAGNPEGHPAARARHPHALPAQGGARGVSGSLAWLRVVGA